MPGSIVASTTKLLDLSTAGSFVDLPVNEGTVGAVSIAVINGAWGGASVSVKKSVDCGRPQAFASPVTFAADGASDAMDTTGVRRLIVTVDTKSSTANSLANVVMLCKGDRITVGSKYSNPLYAGGVADPESPSGPPGGTL